MPKTFIALILASLCIAISSTSNAQDDQFQLPADPAAWLNSPPISMESLKGKAAMLYFFEES